jgi:signal transduction histidine kinase/DNA-binding response OmpR family regulator
MDAVPASSLRLTEPSRHALLALAAGLVLTAGASYCMTPATGQALAHRLPLLAFATGTLLSLLMAATLFLRQRLRAEGEARATAFSTVLHERRQLLRSLLASLPDWVFILDRQGLVLECHEAPNGGWLAREETTGRALRSLLPATAGFDAHMEAALHQGQASFEFELPGAPPRQLAARLALRRDGAGTPDGFTLIARDVTEERARLRQLQRDEEHFRRLFMAAPQPLLLVGHDSHLDANPAALELFGIPSLATLQHSRLGMLAPLLQPDGRASADCLPEILRKAETDGPQQVYWTFQRFSGSELFPAEVTTVALELDGQRCFLSAITDVSAHKRIEAALTQARDAAETAMREKSEFLATMSHEIRTPMNGVLGMAQLLSNTPLNPEQRDYLATVQHSGQSLLTIINDILDFSKIEAGKLAFEETPFDLQLALEETCDLLLPQLREKALTLTVRLDPATPYFVIGDPGRFRQILLNYLSNALKFTPEGGITVALRARESGRGAALFELSVADTGIGIEPAKQNLLFQKFVQADPSTTRRFGGTGLGLAICKALVERMGGDVSMSSTPGQGSVFRATFWMSLDPAVPPPLPALLQPLHDSRVLVIDAQKNWRELMLAGLNRAGLNATGADSVAEAVAALREQPVRYVLLDDDLAQGDSPALLNALRPDLGAASLLLFSARLDRIDHGFCREHGIAAYLPRPARLAWVLSSLNILATGEHEGVVTRQTLATHQARGKALPMLRSGIRVLLAEDNAVNQKVAARMLEKMGCHVDMAGNGLEALVMVSQLPYDLVLMDVQMPEMDGITATRRLRAQGYAALPIIALTANYRDSDRQECREAGMNDFLAKPIRYEDLHACLSRWAKSAVRQPA